CTSFTSLQSTPWRRTTSQCRPIVSSSPRRVAMMAKISRTGGHEKICIALALCLFGSAFALPHPAAAAETLTVTVDQATVMKLPEKVATIVVGNPLIADVAVQSGGLVVVTGKG